MGIIGKIKSDVSNFLDVYNTLVLVSTIGGAFALVLFLRILGVQAPTIGTYLVAVFTAIYAFTSFVNMRSELEGYNLPGDESYSNKRLRIDFFEEEDTKDLGLRNFHSKPIFNLSILVEIDGNKVFSLETGQPPLHLDEGEFVSVLKSELRNLRDPESEIYDEGNKLTFYYFFENSRGARYPERINHWSEDKLDDNSSIKEKLKSVEELKKEHVNQGIEGRTLDLDKIKEFFLESN